MDRQRIDKWLWHARVARTRTAAAGLADGGLVRLNGNRVDAASRLVRIGDVVTIAFDRVRVLRVTGFSQHRGSATDAAALFEDLSPAPAAATHAGTPDVMGGRRPTKQERRDLLRLKRSGEA
ncbi:MAG: RNA-binding S4 domain-containing protein [Pseudomonadota bacterium]